MHIPTVFDSNKLDTFKELQLSDEKLHHLKNVLRIKDMDEIKISNGKGKIYFGNLEGNVVSLKSNQEFERKNHIDVFISFIQDKDRLRFIVEKLTELSVSSITFGPTDHSQKIKVDLDKLNIWSISAVEQSGNAFKPDIFITNNLDFEKFNHGLDITGKHILENNSIKNIAIGPEGGWSNNEKDKFKYLSNIGDFTLRTETASILGVSLLM
ncbi:16S rRNA (uracil(1498)-N(3))-methyltransferase [Acidimicrobiaceae bacterium]|nr:16S rRNA (uracil(1498)-N(3))-methyltransferase [Acidimicrobiaceae bacterium]